MLNVDNVLYADVKRTTRNNFGRKWKCKLLTKFLFNVLYIIHLSRRFSSLFFLCCYLITFCSHLFTSFIEFDFFSILCMGPWCPSFYMPQPYMVASGCDLHEENVFFVSNNQNKSLPNRKIINFCFCIHFLSFIFVYFCDRNATFSIV